MKIPWDKLASKWEHLTDPRKKMDYLMIIVLICIGYFYIFVYQNMIGIDVPFIGLETLIEIPVIAIVVIPLVKWVIIKADPLQRSPGNNKSIRFFQKEFPSNYIYNRCQECVEDQNSCNNYIKPGSFAHVGYWFKDLFHGDIEKDNPEIINETFEKGYNCKLAFYLSWVLLVFVIISLVIIGVDYLISQINNEVKFSVSVLQIVFPVVCLCIYVLVRILNKPDDKNPSGCWQAWREVNGIHVSWLERNEERLIGLICHANGGTKEYKKRV